MVRAIANLSVNQFVVCGPISNEEQTYWHNEHEWITDLDKATTFPKAIMALPLPSGATGIMELTMLGEYVSFFHTPPREGGLKKDS